jgi:hypothetical protein
MDDRHISNGAITIRQDKTGAKVCIGISGELAALLAKIRAREGGADAQEYAIDR